MTSWSARPATPLLAPAAPVDATPDRSTSQYAIATGTPFRLDLTANALRRLSTNVVDLFTDDGGYVRALGGFSAPAVVRAKQDHPDTLTITVDAAPNDHAAIVALIRSMLGVDRDVAHFERAARHFDWLAPLVQRMRGLKPPCYPTLWETFVNTIVFQQVSLHAASAITRRLILALGERVESGGESLLVFPSVESFQNADESVLRGAGLSAGKLGTLLRVGEALDSGAITSEMLREKTSAEASRLLRSIKGIGPWTATIILLRGLARLDVFPPNDSSVAANLANIGGPDQVGVQGALEALGAQRGMLYFYLLLGRLEARGVVGSDPLGHE